MFFPNHEIVLHQDALSIFYLYIFVLLGSWVDLNFSNHSHVHATDQPNIRLARASLLATASLQLVLLKYGRTVSDIGYVLVSSLADPDEFYGL